MNRNVINTNEITKYKEEFSSLDNWDVTTGTNDSVTIRGNVGGSAEKKQIIFSVCNRSTDCYCDGHVAVCVPLESEFIIGAEYDLNLDIVIPEDSPSS